MQRMMMIAFGAVLVATLSVAPRATAESDDNQVPKTFEGSSDAFKEGGQEIGEGFRGVGRGIKKTFKGEAAKGEYKKGEKIGEGFKDIGRGTAGEGRAVGRSFKKGVEANEAHGERPDPDELPPPDSPRREGSSVTEEELR